jgi:enoyl-CoA hydratase/carnithine racemase
VSEFRRVLDDGVLTVTLTRDEKRNAVSPDMLDALRDAATELGDDDGVRVLVIAAEGRFFTAGIDIGRLDTSADAAPPTGTRRRRDYRKLHLLMDELEAIEKPVVLAAQGPCLGFGLELAASVDFRFATPRTTFSLPEITNLAVLPGSGGISRFTRLVGPHWARWLAMAGMSIDAERALTIGFVHQVFPEESFAADVEAFARHLVSISPQALGLAKIAIDAAASADRVTARDVDRVANTLLLETTEHKEKVAAFLKR